MGYFYRCRGNRRRSALRVDSLKLRHLVPSQENRAAGKLRYWRAWDMVQKLDYLGGLRDAKILVMKGYGSFCPVAKAAEILTERWTPLVLRELLLGSRHFNQLRRGIP